jgi:hypothetical protein
MPYFGYNHLSVGVLTPVRHALANARHRFT